VDGRAWHAFDIGVGQKQDDDGCAFILDDNSLCNAARRPGSFYCARHHERCHLPDGSAGERRRLHETEALGQCGRRASPQTTRADPTRSLSAKAGGHPAAFLTPKTFT
jgi:hypothetical protein